MILIFVRVCTLCAVIWASKVAHFLVSRSKDMLSCEYHVLKESKTLDVSQIMSYFGKDVLSLNTPLKNRLMRSSFSMFGPNRRDRADL